MTDVEQGPPSPTQNEVSAVQESQAVEKSKKRKHDGNTHTTPVDRPRRQVHPVIPYSQIAEAKSRTRKPVEVVQGEGIPLGQIPPIARAIDRLKTTDDMIKGLHKLLYGRVGAKHDIKSHIRAFSGFVVGTPIDELVFKEKLEKWKISGLKDMCSLFSLKSSGDKASVVERLFEFLKKPYDTSSSKDRKSKNAKNKKTSTSKTSKKSATARKKTPKDIFFIKQREIFKAKEGNESASRSEVEKQMTEAWNDLSEKEKKPYVSLAENANKSTISKKKGSSKVKYKSPEYVSSDEEEEERPAKKARVVKGNSEKAEQKKKRSNREIKSPEIVESDDEMEDDEKSDEENTDADEKLENDNLDSKNQGANYSGSDDLTDALDETDSENEDESPAGPRKKIKKGDDDE